MSVHIAQKLYIRSGSYFNTMWFAPPPDSDLDSDESTDFFPYFALVFYTGFAHKKRQHRILYTKDKIGV